jgi:hypothetical protein
MSFSSTTYRSLEEVERLKEQVAEFKEAYGQDFDEQIKNLAVEYEQTTDGNTPRRR